MFCASNDHYTYLNPKAKQHKIQIRNFSMIPIVVLILVADSLPENYFRMTCKSIKEGKSFLNHQARMLYVEYSNISRRWKYTYIYISSKRKIEKYYVPITLHIHGTTLFPSTYVLIFVPFYTDPVKVPFILYLLTSHIENYYFKK